MIEFFKKHPAVIFVLASLFFGLEYYALGEASYARLSDNMDAQVLRPIVYSDNLKETKKSSYWMPEMAGGIDRMSNMVSMSDLANIIFQKGAILLIISIILFIIYLELAL